MSQGSAGDPEFTDTGVHPKKGLNIKYYLIIPSWKLFGIGGYCTGSSFSSNGTVPTYHTLGFYSSWRSWSGDPLEGGDHLAVSRLRKVWTTSSEITSSPVSMCPTSMHSQQLPCVQPSPLIIIRKI
jgi:hypothetical protein